MTAVQWRELPPDAPEPPPLSVVRDRVGDWWVHGPHDPMVDEDGHWFNIGGALDSDTEKGTSTTWGGVLDSVPLSIAEPEGVLWPLVESVAPSPYEVRDRALGHAVARLSGYEPGDGAADLALADRYVTWLRTGDGDEVFATAEEWERFKAFDTERCAAQQTTDSRDALVCLRAAGHDGWHSGIREDGGPGAGSWSNDSALDAAENACMDPNED